ncbi:hypothetical protein RHMOL_Rhmol01G0302500 [Rhododendron molle]|uniref:Uncharacterized protein n=2 Tax=Rhododendron molle TaxID=49168 RepID=A0ACC0Q8U2_RHOML|nr:hypothetical protein RHMOL_Rhmol01G0302500 [Rhododendron molle]KAI8573781.1 hypothetical protein RHMOL_Rhmol01G0302500 [Rhododendron molle]
MATLSSQFHITNHKSHRNVKRRTSSSISCSMQPSQSNSKVIINGAAKAIGRAAVVAVTKARGMEVAGAVDSYLLEKILEIFQSKAIAVVVDFTNPSTVYDNVKQATAFCEKATMVSAG